MRTDFSKKGHVFTALYSGGDVLCLHSGVPDSDMNLGLSSLAGGFTRILPFLLFECRSNNRNIGFDYEIKSFFKLCLY